jgi:hypothetical protein
MAAMIGGRRGRVQHGGETKNDEKIKFQLSKLKANSKFNPQVFASAPPVKAAAGTYRRTG